MKRIICSGIALLLLLSVSSAYAGFIPGKFDLGFTPPGPPPWAGGIPPFVFEIVPENSALANLTIDEEYLGPMSLHLSGETDEDPVIAITKNVLNNTADTWYGYEIAVNGGVNTFVPGTATSDTMTLITETANLLTFGLPNPVPSGQSVSFMFDVLIPTTGDFQFDLGQEAIVPEPTAIMLLLLGTGFACCTRRR